MPSAHPPPRHRSQLEAEVLDALGRRPFVTFRRGRIAGRPFVWRSREHRKGLLARAEADLWAAGRPMAIWSPARLNLLIGSGFAVGSLLFLVGSILSLVPALALDLGLSPDGVNRVYFIGSIWFTAAAWLQLFQAANAGAVIPDGRERQPAEVRLIG